MMNGNGNGDRMRTAIERAHKRRERRERRAAKRKRAKEVFKKVGKAGLKTVRSYRLKL